METYTSLPPLRFSKAPARIGDELTMLVVYRDDYPIMHDAFATVVAEPECIDCCFCKAAFLGEVGMPIVQPF